MTEMLVALVPSLLALFGSVQAAPSVEPPLPGRAPRLLSEKEKRAAAVVAIQNSMTQQVKPCVDEQRSPGPGADRISLMINLKLNNDGSLASDPRVIRATGVDDENGRHLKSLRTLAIDAFKSCAPYRRLPINLYKTAWGGWNSFNFRYKLPE